MNRGQFEVNETSLEDRQTPPNDCRVLRVLAYRKMYLQTKDSIGNTKLL